MSKCGEPSGQGGSRVSVTVECPSDALYDVLTGDKLKREEVFGELPN